MTQQRKDPRPDQRRGPSQDRLLGGNGGKNSQPSGHTQLPLTVASIAKGEAEVRVTLDEFKGHLTVDVRLFERFSAAAVMMPTKRGVTLGLAKLPDLACALADAEAKAREMGLIGGGV